MIVDYKNVAIKDIGKVVTGKTPKTSVKKNFGHDYLFVGPSDLHGSYVIQESAKMVSQQGFDSILSNTISGTSVLVGCIGWDMGNVGIVQQKCATNQQINSITEIKSDFNPFYIYYLLKTKKEYLFNKANVTRTPILNKTNFSKIELKIPSKLYQDRVCELLQFIDKKIECNKKIITQLEGVVSLIFDYWFKQFNFPSTNNEPFKASGGHFDSNSCLPVGWEIVNVEALLAKNISSKKLQKKQYMRIGTTPIIDQSSDFICGFTDDSDSIIDASLRPQIVFGDHTRNLKFVNFKFARGADGTQLMNSNTNRMPQELFYMTLKQIDLSNYGYARHFKFLKQTKVVLPDEDTAQKFQDIVSPYFAQVKNLTFENIELEQLKTWILPMLMNGQIALTS